MTQIDRSAAAPPRRRVTLHDVAAEAGLSITTVSRALAGYSDVAQATRLRVTELARHLGYRPSLRARNLAMGRDATLRCAVVSLDLSASVLPQSVYGAALPGILAGAAAEGMDVQLAVMDRKDPAGELERFVAEDRADGILLLTAARLRPSDLTPLETSGIPYVLVNRHLAHEADAFPVNCVTPDWVGGTRDAVRRLHRLGHRRMAAIFSRDSSATSTALDHEQGWREGIAQSGGDAADVSIVHATGPLSPLSGHDIARRLLTEGLPGSGEPVTAIVAYNDHVAHGVLRAARELSIAVPDQLSVIGFDNSIGQYLWPALCSYDPHLYAAAEQAAQLLAGLLRGDAAGDPEARRVTIPLDYVCRETCAPAP
ncbi:LacI family DNA-binding transcriptional regulator [Jiangella alkaliphila]|uniref:LacI family transcriptional regulator n=1 Tax=Jiangella alkaliphila TaxID=419479 RepID=A0A1H2L843_9ACTN|nr:LacI family DNA-binding transcriptional regulator [Jiangella alkaliphila]SDU76895.1 LacI family transcriptional regulator [Jiangella alkaliphila]